MTAFKASGLRSFLSLSAILFLSACSTMAPSGGHSMSCPCCEKMECGKQCSTMKMDGKGSCCCNKMGGDKGQPMMCKPASK